MLLLDLIIHHLTVEMAMNTCLLQALAALQRYSLGHLLQNWSEPRKLGTVVHCMIYTFEKQCISLFSPKRNA